VVDQSDNAASKTIRADEQILSDAQQAEAVQSKAREIDIVT
jgi:hypothetical protein